jgi:hypothetical protein
VRTESRQAFGSATHVLASFKVKIWYDNTTVFSQLNLCSVEHVCVEYHVAESFWGPKASGSCINLPSRFLSSGTSFYLTRKHSNSALTVRMENFDLIFIFINFALLLELLPLSSIITDLRWNVKDLLAINRYSSKKVCEIIAL